MTRSLLPSPYPCAVSMKLTPRSSARFSAATESLSSCGPQLPPIAHAPNPISETRHPVRPNARYRMAAILRASRIDAPRPRLYHRARLMQHATETLSKIFANAQEEARRMNQDFVGTEHLAMALLDLDDSEA